MYDVIKIPDHLDENALDTASGLRQKHKLDTKHKIQDAANVLFGKYGFQATTMEMIAASVDISPRTIFRYFDSKEDLLLSQLANLLNDITEILTTRPKEEDCLTALKASILSVVSDKRKLLTDVITNAIRQIGVDRVAARITTNMHRWESQTSVVFYRRLRDDSIRKLSGAVLGEEKTPDNKHLDILKSTVARLLAAIGASIMENILISVDEQDSKDPLFIEQLVLTAFNFFHRGCQL
ncbi:MAG: TetR/AcrR family transcriptional regulator [Firmicutes bacterium]|jgi:AcrR family transcriptional regulator|nr:TetR/AcrR family transcriptional regulator [Bacillota bacterium]